MKTVENIHERNEVNKTKQAEFLGSKLRIAPNAQYVRNVYPHPNQNPLSNKQSNTNAIMKGNKVANLGYENNAYNNDDPNDVRVSSASSAISNKNDKVSFTKHYLITNSTTISFVVKLIVFF